jgi:hypothetical protein
VIHNGGSMLELDNIELPLATTTTEILRICKELENLIKRKPQSFVKQQAKSSHDFTENELLLLAKSILKERNQRAIYFPTLEFCEPVWDILLDLYISQKSLRKVSVSSCCIASNVPATTALRYISTLTSEGALVRVLDAHDSRRVFLILSSQIEQAIREYLLHVFQERAACRVTGVRPSQHER